MKTDVPELHRLALGLQRDVAIVQDRAVLLDGPGRYPVAAPPLVFEHRLAVDDVAHALGAEHLRRAPPLSPTRCRDTPAQAVFTVAASCPSSSPRGH